MKQYSRLYDKKGEIICVRVGENLVRFAELPNKKADTIIEFLLEIIAKYNKNYRARHWGNNLR